MTPCTKGNYWRYKQDFAIQARSTKEAHEKIERMQAIADEKEYQEDDKD